MSPAHTRTQRRALALILLLGLALAGPAAPPPSHAEGPAAIYLPLLSAEPPATIAFSEWLYPEGTWELFTISDDGSGKSRLTRTVEESELEPAWSPDGRQIAFTRQRWERDAQGYEQSRFAIYVINADGTGERRLVEMLSSTAPAWSPDGRQIAFQGFTRTNSYGEVTGPQVYIVSADGSGLRELTGPEVTGGEPRWSPDGRLIAIVPSPLGNMGSLKVMNADGSGLRFLSGVISSPRHGPAWSPDSSSLVYVDRSAIRIERVDGAPAVELIPSADLYSDPQWSPDGRWILFAALELGTERWTQRIELIRPDGSGRRLLIEPEHPVDELRWSPDGRRIAFTQRDTVLPPSGLPVTALLVMDADGTGLRLLGPGAWPAWRP